MLYKVKNRDLLPLDNRLDRLFLFVMLIFPPFHRFFIHHPEEIGIKLSFARLGALLLGDCRRDGWSYGWHARWGDSRRRPIFPSTCCSPPSFRCTG